MTSKSSVYGLDMNKLSMSNLADTKSFRFNDYGESTNQSIDTFEESKHQSNEKKVKCCKLCSTFLPERCWRYLLMDFLNAKQ